MSERRGIAGGALALWRTALRAAFAGVLAAAAAPPMAAADEVGSRLSALVPASIPRPWIGSLVRYVALNAEQQRAGLDGADVFYGFEGGIALGGLQISGEVTTGDAVERLDVQGAAASDPRLRIWTAAAQMRMRPLSMLPVHGYAGAGLWHFDYRDETVILEFEGIEPVRVAFADFNAPELSAGLGFELAPRPWLGVGLDAGVLALRLNEARIDGDELSVVPHWRTSPAVAVRMRVVL
jgi:hypothetical protein